MPKKQKQLAELLDINEDAIPFLQTLKAVSFHKGGEVETNYKGRKITLVEKVEDMDRFLILYTFHKTLYTNEGFSGDVRVFTFKERTWIQETPNNIVFLLHIYNRSYSNIPSEKTIQMKGLTYSFLRISDTAGAAGATYAALFSVERTLGKEFTVIRGVENEREIMEAIVAAGRIAKSAGRLLIPIHDLYGNIQDAVPLGYDELIFSHVLSYLLGEIRRKNWERGERSVT